MFWNFLNQDALIQEVRFTPWNTIYFRLRFIFCDLSVQQQIIAKYPELSKCRPQTDGSFQKTPSWDGDYEVHIKIHVDNFVPSVQFPAYDDNCGESCVLTQFESVFVEHFLKITVQNSSKEWIISHQFQ